MGEQLRQAPGFWLWPTARPSSKTISSGTVNNLLSTEIYSLQATLPFKSFVARKIFMFFEVFYNLYLFDKKCSKTVIF